VPLDIYNLLTPMALAYWIMGDGSGNGSKGLYIYAQIVFQIMI
jgi:hypothetical protein